MKILIVKLGSIGDIVHALPSLAAIRAALPGAEIGWAVEKRSAEILRKNSMIDHLIEVDSRALRGGKVIEEMLLDVSKQVSGLRRRGFDTALDFQGLLKSGLITQLSGAKKRFGFSKENLREPASRVFYNRTIKVPVETHVIRKNLVLAGQSLKISVPDSDFAFPIATLKEHEREAGEIIGMVSGDFAILNPAGGWVTKLWHAEKFGELSDRIWEDLGLCSVLTTAPHESELADRVLASSHSGKLFRAEPSLKGFFELTKHARVYVGGDTGPTHLAIAAGTPTVGIFGPTEWWRNGSTNPEDVCVERLDIGCRVDCHRRTCSNWICMDISVETVLSAVKLRVERMGAASGHRIIGV